MSWFKREKKGRVQQHTFASSAYSPHHETESLESSKSVIMRERTFKICLWSAAGGVGV